MEINNNMKRILIVIFLVICGFSFQSTYAQDVKKSIQDHYAAVKNMIASYPEDEEYPVHECYQVRVTQNLPGSGRHEENVCIYYGEREDDEIYPSHYLEYVSVGYNFAAIKYSEEYLYDKSGQISFIYALSPDVDEGTEYEFRFYINKGKLFEVLVKNRKMGVGQFVTVYSGKTVPQKYSSFYNKYLEEVSKYKRLFEAIEATTHR